jgi:hypothetical protein
MATAYPTDVIAQAEETLEALKKIDPQIKIGDLTLTKYADDCDKAREAQKEVSSLEAQLTDARNKRDQAFTELWDTVKRVRNGIKGIYGDDSSEYEMVGGTRTSERKKPVRKTKA